MTVNIHFDTGAMSREEAGAMAVFLSTVSPTMLPADALRDYQRGLYSGTTLTAVGVPAPEAPVAPASAEDTSVTSTNGTSGQLTATDTPKRERGKPAPGRARRTKEEIAEDEAADAADAAVKGNISSDPENRVGPEDDAETAAQDAEDEAAEVEANREPEAPLTIEDLKAAMTLYVKKFGMDAAVADGAAIFAALGKPPAGEDYWKATLVAAGGQETLKKAIDAWTAAASASVRSGE